MDLGFDSFEGLGNVVLPDPGQPFRGQTAVRLTGESQRQQSQVAFGIDFQLGRKGKIGVVLQQLHQTDACLLHLRIGDIGVDDDLRRTQNTGRADLPDRELLFEHQERLLGLGFVREGVHVVQPGMDIEVEVRQEKQGNTAEKDADDRRPGDHPGDLLPEPVLVGLRIAQREPLQEGNGQESHLRTQQRKHRRQEGEGGRQSGDHHQNGPQTQRSEERHGNDQHAEQGQHHSGAAEQHRTACGVPRLHDGVLHLQAAIQFLPEPGNDQQRIIDAHRQADHGDHHGHEEDQFEELTDDAHRSQSQHNGYHGQSQRQQGGDHRAEQGEQDYQGDGNAEPLSLLQVLGAQLVVFESHAGISADQYPETIHTVRLFHNVNDIFDVLGGLLVFSGQNEAHDGGSAVGGHQQRLVGQVVVRSGHDPVRSQSRDPVIQRFDSRLETGVVDSKGRGLYQDQLRQRLGPSQPLLEKRRGLLRFVVGAQPELGGGGARKKGLHQSQAHRNNHHPDADGYPGSTDSQPGQSRRHSGSFPDKPNSPLAIPVSICPAV